ncbi:hypothetical protein FI667_g10727, partial [Globisporangium splendens]
MRRGGGGGNDSMSMRPSYRSTTSTGAANGGSGTILVNLDVFIQRATVGHDISPLDEDLIVLFRRNSKEITSEPTRWHSDHVAEWNQHVGIQTSLLRGKKAANGGGNEFLKKEYEVVLVAPQNPVRHKVYRISPLKCRDLAALLEFEIVWDYAKPPASSNSISSSNMTMQGNSKNDNINQLLSIAGLPPAQLLSTAKQQRYPDTASSVSSRRTTTSMSSQSSDRDPLADLVGCSDCRSSKRRLERKEMQILQLESFLKESQKRIDSLIFENEELIVREQAETKNGGQYRVMTIRLLQELEMAFQFCATQVMQAQESGKDMAASFMFLPQFEFMERVKKFHYELDAMSGGGDDDIDGSGPPAGFKNVQDAWKIFDFRKEMETALERNQRLQHQLEFLSRSLVYDVHDGPVQPPSLPSNGFSHGVPQLRRKDTDTSADDSGRGSDNSINDSLAMSRVAPVLTMTEQLNNLERENFVLKAKLESALEDLKQAQNHHSETASASSQGTNNLTLHDDENFQRELEQVRKAKSALEEDKNTLEVELSGARMEIEKLLQRLEQSSTAASAEAESKPFDGSSSSGSSTNAAPGFLNKIYMDVGKAKIALEEKVKQLNNLLREATDDNLRLQAKLEAMESKVVASKVLSVDDDTDMNSASSSDGGPKIAELDDNYVSAKQQDKQKALEKQIQQFQESLDDSNKKLAVKEQELAALRDHMSNREQGATMLESAKKNLENELEEVLKMLMKAQERTTELEGQVKQLQQQLESAQQRASAAELASTPSPSVPSSPPSLVINAGDRGDEVAELTKQLKLSKQEVMQLRYRSNQMESVNERLEEALKEKRTLQVKLTALEGQLFEHRSRTISDNTFATDQNAMVSELQKQLDQRSAQLLISQRELEMMKRELTSRPNTTVTAAVSGGADSATSSTDIDELSAKVKKFELEIRRLCDRNEEQAKKLETLGDRIATVTRERAELQEICQEMVQEMDNLARLHGGGPSHSDDDTNEFGHDEEEDLEEKVPPAVFAPVSVTLPAMITTKKVTDRYLAANNKVASPARQVEAPATATGAGTSKIAHLIKNFSTDESNEASPSDSAVKKPKKFDFRNRNGSNASVSSRSTSTSTGSVVEAMAARFQSGTAAPIEE